MTSGPTAEASSPVVPSELWQCSASRPGHAPGESPKFPWKTAMPSSLPNGITVPALTTMTIPVGPIPVGPIASSAVNVTVMSVGRSGRRLPWQRRSGLKALPTAGTSMR